MRYDTLVEAARWSGVEDPRLLSAIATTPRDHFVPPRHAARAWQDEPIPIGHGQPTSQPSLIAQMIDALKLSGTQTVLEIGTGYGYQTALLARLARQVYSMERHADLAEHARANLASAGVSNAEVVVGDGTAGLPEHAPFDAVVVSATAPAVPAPLAEQLAEGGRLVMPIQKDLNEIVTLFGKRHGRLIQERLLTPARFVPLIGEHVDAPGAEPPER
ncbi:protein-L-isoaspartate(D-aspartate) O-methyltransferase [Nonomuraea sp. NPDC049400]|uniref:protein-L-isoaspartate(D-aspartate) O-methyltransferase n=1 Tax=Nonomuraea sp. NPDC049400 TaxID=3364352 RepID=UPI0037A640CC